MQCELPLPKPRMVCQFSCGAASACATLLTIAEYGDSHDIHIINAFVKEEHSDNRRFLADCERWFGRPITVLRDTKYGASAREVWRRRRFIVGRHGAPCSKALKRDVLTAYHRPGDIIVLGYTADPRDAARLDRYIDANPHDHAMAPLIDAGLTKDDCFRIVYEAGIELPLRYRQGFKNANCDGCCRGGEGYWNFGRTVWPEAFEETAQIQDVLGEGSYFFRNRKTKQRISLRMLDPNAGRFDAEPSFECGAVCELQEHAEAMPCGFMPPRAIDNAAADGSVLIPREATGTYAPDDARAYAAAILRAADEAEAKR